MSNPGDVHRFLHGQLLSSGHCAHESICYRENTDSKCHSEKNCHLCIQKLVSWDGNKEDLSDQIFHVAKKLEDTVSISMSTYVRNVLVGGFKVCSYDLILTIMSHFMFTT